MDRLHCAIRAKHAGDESMLFFLAEEALHPLAIGTGHDDRYHPDELLSLLERAAVYVAECDAEVAGYIAVEEDGADLAVRCVCVGPAYEERAVDDQLVEWAEGLAFSRRLERLTAFVPAADEPSRRLYRRHEFVPRPDPECPEMIVLEKRLAAG